MIIATFGPSTPWVGRTITYEDGQFILEGHGAVTAADVLTYDGQGHISWAYEGLREWVQQFAAASTVAAPASQSRPVEATQPLPVSRAAAKPKRPLYRRWWVIVAGIFVLLMVIGAISDAVSPPEKTKQAAVQPAVKTPTPTVTVTKTAQASPTSATASAAERKYMRDVSSDAKNMEMYLNALSKDLGNYTGSTSQKQRMALAMGFIANTWDRWKNRSAPAPRWKAVHRHWLAGLHDYEKSVMLIAKAIDTNDAAYATQANRYMKAGAKQMNLATASLETIKAELEL